jgi:EmrB/QacA subfamily drug resistance transporter
MRTANRTSTTWIVVLAGIGSLMAALDTVVVAAALSTIQHELDATVEQLEWTVNAYNLSFAVLMITGAALGDRYGRRAGYAAGLGLFSVASAACALAPDAGWLIAARALQGAGAALLAPLSLTLVGAAFPPEKRGAAIGLFSAVAGIAVAAGPTIGGLVIDGISWEWIFWLNVPIGLIAIPFVLTRMQESRGGDAQLDPPGLVLVGGGALGIVWGLVRGNSAGWGSVEVVGALAAGVVMMASFVAWERRAAQPMVPLALFRSRGFATGNAAIFFTFASLFSCVFFFSQLLQFALGYDPLETGLRLLPWTGMFLLVAPVAGAVADRIGERPLMVGGLLMQAVGAGWLALIADPGLGYLEMVGPFLVSGVGVALAIPAAQNAALGRLDMATVGKASGVNSMLRELGGVFGIAVVGAVFAGVGGYASAQAFTDGFGPAIALSAGLALIGAIASLAMPPRPSEPTADVVAEPAVALPAVP